MKQDRLHWIVRVIRDLDRALERALVARRLEPPAPVATSTKGDERELRVCLDTLRAAVEALEQLHAQLQQESLRYGELVEFLPAGCACDRGLVKNFFAASLGKRPVDEVTKRDRIDWLLTAIHAVEDLVQPRLKARRLQQGAQPSEQDEDLEVCVEELRVAAEELVDLKNRLALERQRYAELFEFAPEPYLELDARWNVREANRAAAALIGFAPEQLAGRPLGVFLTEDARAELRSRVGALALDAGWSIVEFETRVRPREGPMVAVRLRASPSRDPQGRLAGVRCLLRPMPAQTDAAAESG